jgi:hypothetical protein
VNPIRERRPQAVSRVISWAWREKGGQIPGSERIRSGRCVRRRESVRRVSFHQRNCSGPRTIKSERDGEGRYIPK